MKWGGLGKIALPKVLGINRLFVIIPFVILTVLFF
jgi:hypothetical protein